jgi:hypothetical protein
MLLKSNGFLVSLYTGLPGGGAGGLPGAGSVAGGVGGVPGAGAGGTVRSTIGVQDVM